jgi:DNA-binding NarL/FixJ family response regulator
VALEPTSRVVLADDHVPTRAAIGRVLEEGGFTICAEAADAVGAMEAVRRERPDIALLDIRMPGNGIRAAVEIGMDQPEVAVVMLTVSRDDRDLFDALRAGASGYLLKDTDPKQLPHELRAVLDGEAVLSGALMARLIEEFRRRGERSRRIRDRDARLSSREWEVLELLADGLTTAEIAERLFVAKVTVRTHVSAILKKLRVPDRAAAVDLVCRSEAEG